MLKAFRYVRCALIFYDCLAGKSRHVVQFGADGNPFAAGLVVVAEDRG